MNSPRWSRGLLVVLFGLAGCAHQSNENVFTVQKIDSLPRDNGGVRVKLTTNGDLAEADESLLVAYVKIVAVHEATRQQRQLAADRARKIFQAMTVGHRPRKARYLAVATQRTADSKGGKIAESVMIWDTQTQTIVGDNVYDVSVKPAYAQVARFETYSAEYVGSGL